MPPRPDYDHDVIIHQPRRRFGDRGYYRDTWTIWLERVKQGERDSLEAAIELASDVAAAHSRPVWLLNESGYPLKPIEAVAIHRGGVDVPGLLPDLDKAPACPRCGSIATLKLGETGSSTWITCNTCQQASLVRRSARQPSALTACKSEALDHARPAAAGSES